MKTTSPWDTGLINDSILFLYNKLTVSFHSMVAFNSNNTLVQYYIFFLKKSPTKSFSHISNDVN